MNNNFKEYLNECIKSDFEKIELNEASKSELINTQITNLNPSLTDFKTLNRRGIITLISLMLDNLNMAYQDSHNGETLFGKSSVYRKLITK